MVDRSRENAALLEVAQRVRDGATMVVTLEGEAGSGKSHLISDFSATVTDFTTVNALPSRVITPTLFIVDDAQWLPPEACETIERALENPSVGPLLIIVAARTEESELVTRLRPASSRRDRGLVITLVPLTAPQVVKLAAELGVIALEPARAQLLAELTDGNPLHLTTVIAELGQRLHVAVPRDLPVPPGFQTDLVHRLGAITAPGRAFIELLAIVGEPVAISTLAEIAARLDREISFDAAVASGFVRPRNSHGQREVELPSSRVRQAVRQSFPPTIRRAHHAAAAESFAGSARLEHRLLATEHTDDGLAAELEAEGTRLTSAGRYSEAARLYSGASGVSSTTSERERRLLFAGALAFYSDDAELASTIVSSVARCSPSREREMVLGGLGYVAGDFAESLAVVRAAIADDPSQPVIGFAAAVVASIELAVVDIRSAIQTAELALSVMQHSDDIAPHEAKIRITSGFGLWIAGLVDASDAVLAPLLALPLHRPERADALTLYVQREFYGGDASSALHSANRAIEASRASNATHILPLGLALRAHIEYSLGQWDAAMEDAHAVLSHTSATRNGNHDVLAHSAIAMLTAQTGELEFAESAVRVARRLGEQRPLPQHSAAAGLAAAVVERAGGHPYAVIHALTPLGEGTLGLGLTSTGFTGWRVMLAEALIQVGSYDRAREVITMLDSERGIPYFGYPLWVRGLLAEALGDLPSAIAAYKAAVATGDKAATPFAHALALRALGALLAATSDGRSATAAHAAADRLFRRLGATAYLVSTSAADTATVGGGLDTLAGWTTLTPRERDTAVLVASGMLNREIAAEMHVAVKTVEHHVANSLAKLGLRSRRDLEKAAGQRS
ncbi:MAG: LuxR C-terminal-related transcriptional regulator [Microbacteriaceae bacterium]